MPNIQAAEPCFNMFSPLCSSSALSHLYLCCSLATAGLLWALSKAEHNPKPSSVMRHQPSPMWDLINTVSKRMNYFVGQCKNHVGLKRQLSPPERSVFQILGYFTADDAPTNRSRPASWLCNLNGSCCNAVVAYSFPCWVFLSVPTPWFSPQRGGIGCWFLRQTGSGY